MINEVAGYHLGMGETPAGWYPDPGGGGQRYFDGEQWTPHRTVLSRDQRADILDAAVAELLQYGGRIESRTGFQAIIVSGSQPNHVVHVLLTIFTCFLWAPIWLLVAASQKVKRTTVSVGPDGRVAYFGPMVPAAPLPEPQRPSPFRDS